MTWRDSGAAYSRVGLVAGVLALLLLLVSCAGSGDPDGVASDAATPAVEPTAAPTAESTAIPAPTATPALAPAAAPTGDPAIRPVVFNDDFGTSIAPILAEKCADCHNEGGPGTSQWRLNTAADVSRFADRVAGVVSFGVMPPWPASKLSVPFVDDRSLRPDQVQAIVDWATAGGRLDVAPETQITSLTGTVGLDFDVELAPLETYDGSPAIEDDYRCLIYDPKVTEPTWMRGFEFVADQTEVVHHAIGYLAPAAAMGRALALSAEDPQGGWQCYGGSELGTGDDLFLGWAPGQLPTVFPDGTGIAIQPGDFVVLQIHYHFQVDAPADDSRLRLDWADGSDELDPIVFGEYIAPAEIPCRSDESGPLCDRDAAIARAIQRYGAQGVLADGINALCGVTPADFAEMTDGVASSSCSIPVLNFGEILSVFGHEHEIGKSFRMTLNAGRPDERILLDIANWSFDWQFYYSPVESVVLKPGDVITIECSWDRARRDPNLEPAYVLWANGTNDEMCFSTIATRQVDGTPAPAGTVDRAAARFELDPRIAKCLADANVSVDHPPARSDVAHAIEVLFGCAAPDEVGALLADSIGQNFGGFVSDTGLECLAEGFADPTVATNFLTYSLPDSTAAERRPIAELGGDCVLLSETIAAFGLPLPDAARACVDNVGRDLIVKAMVDRAVPEEQVLFATVSPCLSGG